ncbi:hypothetical protein HDV00_012238 [Rhizophlyctis rosea]|nr:hypothetical protein HDV00_012238 [Rhizophlyctis rosea]
MTNFEKARAALARYHAKEGGAASTREIHHSRLNTLGKEITHNFTTFHEPLRVLASIHTSTHGLDHKSALADMYSFVLDNLEDADKLALVDQHLESRVGKGIYSDNVPNWVKFATKEQKMAYFQTYYIHEVGVYKGYLAEKKKHRNPRQKMSEKQRRAYQPFDVLLEKLLKLEREFQSKLESGRSGNVKRNRFHYQFIVAGLIYLLAKRNRRLDIQHTMLEDGPDVNVYLCKEGIHIKECNKTKETNVLLDFGTDERLTIPVNTLCELRLKYGDGVKCLFVKEEGKSPSTDTKWFASRFESTMKALGVGVDLTMGMFRLAYCIRLTELHERREMSVEDVEKAAGHSWRTHEKYYSLSALESGQFDYEKETDDESSPFHVDEPDSADELFGSDMDMD